MEKIVRIKFHILGTKHEDDKLIFHEKDDLYSVSAEKASSKEYLFINIFGHR